MQVYEQKDKARLVEIFGSIVREHRLSQQKTIYKIAAEASISKSTWREVELGMCNDINLSTMWKIAEGLDIALDELIRELREKVGIDVF